MPILREVTKKRIVDPEQACENISFARCMNSEVSTHLTLSERPLTYYQHQYELLDSLAPSFATGEYKLLVIDSVMGCFRTDYQGRGELSERQQKLGQYLDKVKAMAEQFNLAVLMASLATPFTITRLISSRPTRFSLILEQVRCSLAPTVVSL
jgi:meiotic recombination protein DMC1